MLVPIAGTHITTEMPSEETEPFPAEPEEPEEKEAPEPKTRKVDGKGDGKGGAKGKAPTGRWATGTPTATAKPLGGIFGGGPPTKAQTAKAAERSLDLAMGADAA